MFSLYFARVLGGICYSLLFSSFEAWAIAECDRKKIHRRNLARLFASATFFNALSAVVAGIIGNAVVDTFSRKNGYYTGSQSRTLPRLQTADEARVERPLPELRIKTSLFVTEKEPNEFAPAFDVAAGALFLCGCLCASLWVNNKTKVNREDEENDEGDENASFEEDGDGEDQDREDEEDATKMPPRGRTLRKTRRKRRGGILESFKNRRHASRTIIARYHEFALRGCVARVCFSFGRRRWKREKMPIKRSPGLSPTASSFRSS